MLKLGNNNTLQVSRLVDFGAYLSADNGIEILLPKKYITTPLQPGQEIDVFVYNDSSDRPVATTEIPFARVGEFAFLQVADVNKFGAFLDWGIPSKHLLVPFSEQTVRLTVGMVALVYIYVDHNSGRIVASAKIDKFLGNEYPRYKRGRRVDALIYKHTENGYKAIVDNRFHGLIYESDLYKPLIVGEPVAAYVKQVRSDGKIDLLLSGGDDGRVDSLTHRIMDSLKENGGVLAMSDNSSPEEIREAFNCSKKDFKKALGKLYHDRLVRLSDKDVRLV
ncbi:MAG: GntR family transcriptional regulator [Duncaniella sp.]|nr:GntR family transcriptional regulator [Duncaniella sp.]